MYESFPIDAIRILVVLLLSLLIGLEREDRKAQEKSYAFGGVRTFPLIGLIGYSIALLCGYQFLPLMIGFLVIGCFLLLSYWHKLKIADTAGVTTEMSGLATFLTGALIYYGHLWIATTLVVASVLLLDLKAALERLAVRIAPNEILTFAKFLLLTGVILPILPRQEFIRFHINPFRTWLVVVAISAISYGSYLLQKATRSEGGVVLTALLGGAYSSTITTVALARRAAHENYPYLFAGSILIASGVMYLRLGVLLLLFNRHLLSLLGLPFLGLAGAAIGGGWLWTRRASGTSLQPKPGFEASNPLNLGSAFLFAGWFLAMVIATQLAGTRLGWAGVRALAAIMGIADVDPFIMGMTQTAGASVPLHVAAEAVLIAASSNNLCKGIYAYTLADHATGRQSLALLSSLAAAGLVPLWCVRA